jgi:hypothetical protein
MFEVDVLHILEIFLGPVRSGIYQRKKAASSKPPGKGHFHTDSGRFHQLRRKSQKHLWTMEKFVRFAARVDSSDGFDAVEFGACSGCVVPANKEYVLGRPTD